MRRFLSRFLPPTTLLVLLLTAVIAHAQDEPVVVRFAPENAQVAAGETVAVGVEAVAVEALYGFSVALTFDAGLLQVQDADPSLPGVQVGFGTLLEPGVVIVNRVDNNAGLIEFAMTQLNPSPAQNGTGNLIVITFLGGVAGRVSPLDMLFVQLAAPRGVEIPAVGSSGSVEILADAPPGPTNTPVPTQPAGTTLPSPTPPGAVTPAPTSTDRPTATAQPPTPTTAPSATGAVSTPSITPTQAADLGQAESSPASPSAFPSPTGTEPSQTAAGTAEQAEAPAVTATAATVTAAGTGPAPESDEVAEAEDGDAGDASVTADEAESVAGPDSTNSATGPATEEPSVIGEDITITPVSAQAETDSGEGVLWAAGLLGLAGIAFVVGLAALGLRRRQS